MNVLVITALLVSAVMVCILGMALANPFVSGVGVALALLGAIPLFFGKAFPESNSKAAES